MKDLLNSTPVLVWTLAIITLGCYVFLRTQNIEGGPLDELLLILGGAVAGIAVPRRTNIAPE